MDKEKERLEKIIQGFKAYEKVVDREVHYVFFDENTKTYKELVFHPHKEDFMHLCGVTYQNWNGKRFYAALRKSLRKDKKTFFPTDLTPKCDGTTDQKLQIIEQLNSLLTCNNLRIINKETVYFHVRFDKAIRSNRMIFCLGLVENGSGTYGPMSLLNLKGNNKGQTIDKGCPVYCIYTVDHRNKTKEIICKTTKFEDGEQKKPYPYPY